MMGNFLYSLLFRRLNVVCIGLDGAGKTTVLYSMHKDCQPHTYTMPTVGFNVEKLTIGGLNINTWDLGGQEQLREYWIHYMRNLDALVYVVDSMDRRRLEQSKTELHRILNHPEINRSKAPLAILLNKCDHRDVTKEDLDDVFEVSSFLRTARPVEIFETVANQGKGLQVAFNWLVQHI